MAFAIRNTHHTTDHPGAFGHRIRPTGRRHQVAARDTMSFVAFLIGTVLVSSLVLLVMLLAPRALRDVPVRAVPITGLALAGLLLVFGFISGLTLAG